MSYRPTTPHWHYNPITGTITNAVTGELIATIHADEHQHAHGLCVEATPELVSQVRRMRAALANWLPHRAKHLIDECDALLARVSSK